jgi:hypothetical protein
MPKLNLSFDVGLNGMNTIVLGSTQPRHLNTKILHVSLFVPRPVKPKTSNITQMFLKKQLW